MKILLLGIGNVLYADEGVGVHFVNYINENYQFCHLEHDITLLDGGTLAQGLIPIICQYDHLIVIDTVNANDTPPGQVYFFDFDKAPHEIDWQGSAHEVEMLQTLNMMDMVGDRPKTFVLGVTPTVLEPMLMGLTPQILAAIPVMEHALIQHLTDLNFVISRKANIDINSLIPSAYRRGITDEHHQI